MAQKQQLTRRKYTAIDLVRLVFGFAPWQTALRFLITFIGNGSYPFLVVMAAGFIDTAIAAAKGEADISQAVVYIAFVVLMPIYERAQVCFRNFLNINMENVLRKRCRAEAIERRARLEYHYIENEKTRDLIERVCKEIDKKLMDMLSDVLAIAGLVVRLAGLAAILLAHVPWAVAVLVAGCVPIILIGYRGGKQMYDANKEVTKLDRAADNYSQMLISRENIDERSVFGYVEEINARYIRAFEQARIHRKNADKKSFTAMKSGAVVLVLVTGAMALPLLYATAAGNLSIGVFVAILPAFADFGQSMSWTFSSSMRRIREHTEYLKDLTEFMELETASDAAELPNSPPVEFESLEFIGVSFKYPGTERLILDNMSFRIEKGRHYAVVGVNGAGKTTITKLITGLYDQYEGTILLNGKDLRQYTGAELRSALSVVYQDFAKYTLSLGENVLLGDSAGLEADRAKLLGDDGERLNLSANMQYTQSGGKLLAAARLLGIDETAGKLSQGYDAQLGKIKKDGVDISGGEWQRVAMARAVVSPAGLKILDEPTAALDPISESNVYKQFESIIGGSTTIFISHRLGSTKLADTILVVDEGKVTEIGTHDDLMAKHGLYADMYASQASWYAQAG